VKVADGYARNYLLSERLAFRATDSNNKIVEHERERVRAPRSEDVGDRKIWRSCWGGVHADLSCPRWEKQSLFGSGTSKDIAGALEAQSSN